MDGPFEKKVEFMVQIAKIYDKKIVSIVFFLLIIHDFIDFIGLTKNPTSAASYARLFFY